MRIKRKKAVRYPNTPSTDGWRKSSKTALAKQTWSANKARRHALACHGLRRTDARTTRSSPRLLQTAALRTWPVNPHGTNHQSSSRRDHRSEEHTSELQSRFDLVCRLLLEKN